MIESCINNGAVYYEAPERVKAPTIEERRSKVTADFLGVLNMIDQGRPVKSFGVLYLDSLINSYRDGMSRRQVIISFTKWMHNFNVSDKAVDLELLRGEVDEAEEALEKQTAENFAKELADVAIYCYGLAQMAGYDLDTVIEDKMRYNLERRYMKEEK